MVIAALVGLGLGYCLLLPMSDRFVRYLIWQWSSPASVVEGSVQSQGTKIHYVSYGHGPAVLLLHGGLSHRLSWFAQIPWLVESGRQVVLIDSRGHGDSGLGKAELTYRLLAEDAVAVLDTLHIQQTDVIGWSDGGNTALMLGLYWPDRIRRLVAISANFNPSGLTPTAQKESSGKSSGMIYWIKRWWTGAGRHLTELETRVERLWRTRPQLEPMDLTHITCPTLVIVGQKDSVSIAHATTLSEALPHGTLAIVPGGHATPVTHPQQVNALISRFLARDDPMEAPTD